MMMLLLRSKNLTSKVNTALALSRAFAVLCQDPHHSHLLECLQIHDHLWVTQSRCCCLPARGPSLQLHSTGAAQYRHQKHRPAYSDTHCNHISTLPGQQMSYEQQSPSPLKMLCGVPCAALATVVCVIDASVTRTLVTALDQASMPV